MAEMEPMWRRSKLRRLERVFENARVLLAKPDNDFSRSSWEDQNAALDEIDSILKQLRSGVTPDKLELRVLFAPTGPIQETSLSSGWGDEFLKLARRFDFALAFF